MTDTIAEFLGVDTAEAIYDKFVKHPPICRPRSHRDWMGIRLPGIVTCPEDGQPYYRNGEHCATCKRIKAGEGRDAR